MFFRIVICLAVAVLSSCTTARMAMVPALEVDSDKYQITERPTFLLGGDLVFGPYQATEISRGFINGTGEFTTIGKITFGKKTKGQDYTYQFKGQNSWNGSCKVREGHSEVGIVSNEYFADIDCAFVPLDSGSSSAAGWKFSIKGEDSGTAKGSLKLGSKTIKVSAINKIESSPLVLGQHTGYYFYSGQTLVAAVDAINKKGPVWLSKKLSQTEKDTIAMVAVALLLNQVY